MTYMPGAVTALSSTIVRVGAYIFLRWIPGHHFPPLIIGSLIVYLTCVFAYSPFLHPEQTVVVVRDAALTYTKISSNGKTQDETEEVEEVEEAEEVEEVIEVVQFDENDGLIGQGDKPATFERENVAAAKVALTGIPHPDLKRWSLFTVGLNVLLGLFTLDMVFRGPALHPTKDLRFSRVGFVDTTSAKVLFREPDPSQLPIYAYYQREGQSTWTIEDKIYFLDADTDYTYPITFSHLSPSATHTYWLSNNLTGSFTTAPLPFSPAGAKLTFVTSSCIKANFPYNPLSYPLSIPGFAHLSRLLTSLPSPAAFMLFLGDFIYVDVPLRLASSTPHYRSEYRRIYASPSWSLPGLSSLPWLHTIDDHEIANDWFSGNSTAPFPAARDPFLNYHVSVNPPTPPSAPPVPNTTYFAFTRGPASFFMLDTRAYRTAPEPNPNATILGQAQLSCLLDYLSTPEPANVQWKIIASSVPFTQNWRIGTSDTWGGFLAERSIVLAAMHAAEALLGVRVIILSGDRHEFGAIRFPSNPWPPSAWPTSGPHEFSVGPLSMFYLPFRSFRQVDEQDVVIKYVPDGNSKIGVVDITNLEGGDMQKSLLKYTLYVDGKIAWEYALTSPSPEFNGYRGGLWS